mmetsp:Transcript_39461/g.77653  ORF Transcript_39461/g.77653 Transcript_39461/m.77653 type:complete len:236 (-) Transcript_39461:275-982(-)
MEESPGLGRDGLGVHSVHDGFLHGDLLHDSKVEPPHSGPEPDLLLLVLSILDRSNPQRGVVRVDQTTGLQPLVSTEEHGVQHAFIQKKVSHPLRHDDVNFIHRQFNFLCLSLHKLNHVCQTVVCHQLPGHIDNLRALDADHLLGTSTGSEHRQNSTATSNIQNHLVFEQVFVLQDCFLISSCSHGILEHLLMNAKVRIRIEVVVCRAQLLLRQSLPTSGELGKLCVKRLLGLRGC